MKDWPFSNPPNFMTITTRPVVDRGRPILLVTREADDGTWQFLTGDAFHFADAMVVTPDSMILRDPSLRELADLPLGWQA